MFKIEGDRFTLNGKPFTVMAGEIHYFRLLPEYWYDSLLKLKLAGLNTVQTYICWSIHEPEKGSFDFSGRYDFGRFLAIARELGLYAIVRPSPYICAEFDLGGLPPWLLREGVEIRTSDPRFLGHVRDYYRELIPRLLTHDNIIMMQVENEYGCYGCDKAYLQALADLMREFGVTVPLFTSDGAERGKLTGGTLAGIMPTVNFGSRTEGNLAALKAFAPDNPLMCAEFWNGWFDHWGEKHHRRPAGEVTAELRTFLDAGASFSLYTFHGGTNFGFTAGANHDGRYMPTVTSYDDDALLTEWGGYTPKYHAVRRLIHEYTGEELQPLQPMLPLQNPGEVTLTESASLMEQADKVGVLNRTVVPPTMESIGQNSGFMLYRHRIIGDYEPDVLTLDGLADRAHVFLNGRLCGILYRGDDRYTLRLPELREGDVLEVLLEAMGRVNYGPRLFDPKGIGGVRIGGQYLHGWETMSLPMDDPDSFEYSGGRVDAPMLLRGRFHAADRADCFLHLDGFTKGVVWVNGFNLGRYWSIGPQRSLYLPGVLLRDENTVIVLELDGTDTRTVSLTDKHDIG